MRTTTMTAMVMGALLLGGCAVATEEDDEATGTDSAELKLIPVSNCVKSSYDTRVFTGVYHWCARNGKIIGAEKKDDSFTGKALFAFKLPDRIPAPLVDPLVIKTEERRKLSIDEPRLLLVDHHSGSKFLVVEGGKVVDNTFTRAEKNAWDRYNKDLRAYFDGQRW